MRASVLYLKTRSILAQWERYLFVLFQFVIYSAIAIFLFQHIFFVNKNIYGFDWGIPERSHDILQYFQQYGSAWNRLQGILGGEAGTLDSVQVIINLPRLWPALLGIDAGMVLRFSIIFIFNLAGFGMYALLRFMGRIRMSALIGSFLYITLPSVFNWFIISDLSLIHI